MHPFFLRLLVQCLNAFRYSSDVPFYRVPVLTDIILIDEFKDENRINVPFCRVPVLTAPFQSPH